MLPDPPASSDELTPALRLALHQEVHARPPQELRPPVAVTHWAFVIREAERDASRAALADLLQRHGQPRPAGDAVFVQAKLGSCSLRWELHTEFVVWTFFRPLAPADLAGFAAGQPPAAEAPVPAEWLADAETELAALAHAVGLAEHDDEPRLLDRLTHLAAQLESLYAGTHTRFSASAAYHALLRQRLTDIQEERIDGLQPLRDFLERRLTPAMATCRSADTRQAALSARIARIGNLLRTRVEVEQQRSSRALLATMNRRQGLQLKLQSTVEGLSVAAITYYVVGLIGHLAEGAQTLGWPVGADATMALAIPVVALAVWWSLRSLHRSIERSEGEPGPEQRAPRRERA